jgi:hypothetical protein
VLPPSGDWQDLTISATNFKPMPVDAFSQTEQATSAKAAISDNVKLASDLSARNASVIYYHHGQQHFRHVIGRLDNDTAFVLELTELQANIQRGLVSAISAGKSVNINGADYFPMDVKVDKQPCIPYMLIRGVCNIGYADNTPFFFRSEDRRNEVTECLGQYLAKELSQDASATDGD